MTLCINAQCPKPQNSENTLFCQACGSELLLEGRYRVTCQLGAGGFAKTFEVNHNNTLKVLKVLMLDDPKAVSLFQQEVQVLSHLNHPGIPKGDGYFTFSPKNSKMLLHCLVMEKIEGLDLHQYMEQRGNRPIDEKLALSWLAQLANILHEVHQQNFFHRDIKPSNIMLKPDGNLALIDFGTVREVTQTYYQKAAGQNITGIISPGYTPLEQANGKAVPQSDFFALGRTFVYLLTGKSPDQFHEDPRTGKLIWRDSALQISKQVAGFIDYLMEIFPGKRPQNAQIILQCLSEIHSNLHSYSSHSVSQLPPTEIKKPKQSTQRQTQATTPIQSSNTETNIFSSKIAQFIGGVIAFAILFLIKFGSRGIYKLFNSHPTQPAGTSTSTELQGYKQRSSQESVNNYERVNTDSVSQQSSIYEENISLDIPSGWKKFEGGGAELWLSESWQSGNLNQLFNKNLDYSKSQNPNIEEFFQSIKETLSNASIFAINPTSGQMAMVLQEQIPAKTTLESYLQETNEALSSVNQSVFRNQSVVNMVDFEINQNGKYETAKAIFTTNNGLTGIIYYLKDKDTLWNVAFFCKSHEFKENLPIFEKSIYTFSSHQ